MAAARSIRGGGRAALSEPSLTRAAYRDRSRVFLPLLVPRLRLGLPRASRGRAGSRITTTCVTLAGLQRAGREKPIAPLAALQGLPLSAAPAPAPAPAPATCRCAAPPAAAPPPRPAGRLLLSRHRRAAPPRPPPRRPWPRRTRAPAPAATRARCGRPRGRTALWFGPGVFLGGGGARWSPGRV
jgi:hypothetical protein